MKLTLQREPSQNETTLGKLYVDGVYQCETLEDVVREQMGVPVAQWKVAGRTAIPAGTYQVQLTWSPRLSPKYENKLMPIITGVEGFTGIRIHSGNTDDDTEGCVLVGKERVGNDRIVESRVAWHARYDKLEAAWRQGEGITIEVLNPEKLSFA